MKKILLILFAVLIVSQSVSAKPVSLYVGNPIHAGSGNKYQRETDISTSGGSPLRFVRHYNSQDSRASILGTGWRHYYERTITLSQNGTLASVNRENGRVYDFTNNSGNWTGEADVSDRLNRNPDNSWTYSRPNGTVEQYNAAGKLTAVVLDNGKTTLLTYNASGQPVTVTGPYGRTLTMAYVNDRLDTLSDSATGVYTYAYDANDNLVSVLYPDSSVRQYHYEDSDFSNALTGITDERGIRYATYGYDSKGRGILTEHAGGVDKVTLVYNADGTTTVTDSLQRASIYTFSSNLNAFRVEAIDGPGCSSCDTGNSSATYDANNNVTSKTENGVTTAYGNYDAYGNPGYIIEAQGTPEEQRTDYTYDSRFPDKVSSITTASVYASEDKTVVNTYDDYGNRTSESIIGYRPDGTPISRMTNYQYNGPYHQLSQIDGPRTDRQDITTLEYYPDDPAEGNNRARLQRLTTPVGVMRDNIQYSHSGKILSEDRPNGLSLSYTYYAGSDRLETLTETDGTTSRTTRWTYLPSGETASITRADGSPDATTITFGYDDARRLTSITDGLGNKIKYTLDSEGNKISESIYDSQDILHKSLSRTFDEYNRLNLFSQANEQQDSDYNPDGTLNKVTDGNNVVTDYSYDAMRRLVSITQDPGGTDALTQYGYDAANRLIQVTDPNNGITQYVYDDLGNLLSQASPDTGTATFAYDEAGNLIQKTDAKGQVFNYSYDAANRLTMIQGPGSWDFVTYTYDVNCGGQTNQLGQLCYLKTKNSGDTGTRYSYDAFGQITGYSTGSLFDFLTSGPVQYQYDLAGRVNQITYPSGAIVSYNHNPAGQVSQVELNYQGQTTVLAGNIQYAPFGPVTDLVYDNGLTLSQGLDSAYRYTTHTVSGILELANSQYDANGNLIQIDDNLALNRNQYGYDNLNRIDSAVGTFGIQDFTYDDNSNRLQYSQDGIVATYLYEPNSNRLQEAANDPVSLDANGNTLQRGDWSYTYNSENRLLEVRNNGTLVANYTYNGLGQRIRKTVAGLTTGYIYGLNGELLHEVNSDGQIDYIYLNGRPLAMLQQDQIYYIHTDHLGTPRAVSDSRGKAMWIWDSDPFGQTQPEIVGKGRYAADFVFNFRFPGQYYDEETGLHYNYYRYYDPSTGRYMTSDPIGLYGGLNTYAYVRGNPISSVDFLGLLPNCFEGVKTLQRYEEFREEEELIYKERHFVIFPGPAGTPDLSPDHGTKGPKMSPGLSLSGWIYEHRLWEKRLYRILRMVEYFTVYCSEIRKDECGKEKMMRWNYEDEREVFNEETLIDKSHWSEDVLIKKVFDI